MLSKPAVGQLHPYLHRFCPALVGSGAVAARNGTGRRLPGRVLKGQKQKSVEGIGEKQRSPSRRFSRSSETAGCTPFWPSLTTQTAA